MRVENTGQSVYDTPVFLSHRVFISIKDNEPLIIMEMNPEEYNTNQKIISVKADELVLEILSDF